MSKKIDLINTLTGYKEKYTNIQADIENVKNNNNYTELGKIEEIKKIVNNFAPIINSYHDMAISIIDNGLAGLASKYKENSISKLFDGGYQAGLANVIKMLELGAIIEKSDIENIIEMYKNDVNALATIGKIIGNSQDAQVRECVVLIPSDNRNKNNQLLEQLKKNIDQYINTLSINTSLKAGNGFDQMNYNISISLDGMIEFVTNRLDDDLQLLQ